jgi:hypothetical protein
MFAEKVVIPTKAVIHRQKMILWIFTKRMPTGERAFERIILPIVIWILNTKRQNPRREERPRMRGNALSPVILKD